MRLFMRVVAFGILGCAAGQPQAPDPAVALPASRPFSSAREINTVLPGWLRFGGEYRARFEGYTGGSFKPGTTDAYWLSRVRLNLTIQPTHWLKLFAEGQDARAIAKQPGLPPYENTWDIRQGYVELGDMAKGRLALRAGRQELLFADERLIGITNWSNASRTFDAVRATLNYSASRADIHFDLFAASVVTAVNDTWDHHQQGNDLHGIRAEVARLIPGATLETYIYWRLQPGLKNESGAIARLDERVPGLRLAGKLPSAVDYQMEMVKETGSLGSDKVRAWAGHWSVGRTAAVAMKPRVWLEYNYASGDANAKDGIRGTFDQLYPSGHDKYGFSDQVGWKNMRDVRGGLETKPRANWTATLEYNNWYLASPFDALYNSSGTAISRSATGTAGTHIGQELDLITTWKPFTFLQAGAGIAHIFPGEFLRKTTPGNPYTYPYMVVTYKF